MTYANCKMLEHQDVQNYQKAEIRDKILCYILVYHSLVLRYINVFNYCKSRWRKKRRIQIS